MLVVVRPYRVDVWDLLIHDQPNLPEIVDAGRLECHVNGELESLCFGDSRLERVWLTCPDMGSVWRIWWKLWSYPADEYASLRYTTQADIRRAVPDEVAAILDELNRREIPIN